MLEIVFSVLVPGEELHVFDAEIGNVSDLRATSSYEYWLEGREFGEIKDYPRWSEPVRSLLARCIANSLPGDAALPANWTVARVDIGINSGGRSRRPTRLAMVRLEQSDGDTSVGWIEGRLRGFKEIALRETYADVWELALHMLCESVWLKDALPQTRPLYVPYYCDDTGYPYMDPADLPEPLRSAFERRQRYSGRPFISGCWMSMSIHDFEDFVNGQRG